MVFLQISISNMLPTTIKISTELGLKVKELMDNGNLVTNELVIALFKQRIAQNNY